ncbi:hypothetical protein MRB53_026482 [Persea americana]|uniref:Uncharacterized protein n=1 Tax=Persea americana TaxID=3435 RepID=A0ACC2LI63_PERAE|nr:hypothetical protein MRB53_026482 [Persea americana]
MSSAPLLEGGGGTNEGQVQKKWWEKMMDVEEAKHQVLFSLPMIITNVSYYCITLVSVMFAGHLGNLELAGSTLANSWATVTGLALMTGLSGALETLCGQGFGAKIYRMLGIYLQSSIITCFVFSVIVSVLWFFSEQVLILLHQEPEIAKMADAKCRDSPRHMLSSSIYYPQKFKYTWEGLSMECFQYVLPNMKLAIPSAVMVCLEYWAFELLVLLAGLMPDAENTTSLIAICVNTEAVTFMLTYGFSAAVSTRVSNELGAGNVDKAKNAVSVTLRLSVLLATLVILSLIFGHNIWATSFSDSQTIIKQFAYMTPFLAISILFDSAQGVLSGVSRGCGWQHLAAWTNLAAFYVIGMPISILLGFKFGLYSKGLWIGLICGLFCQACTLLLITLRTKWTRMELSVPDKQNHVLVLNQITLYRGLGDYIRLGDYIIPDPVMI